MLQLWLWQTRILYTAELLQNRAMIMTRNYGEKYDFHPFFLHFGVSEACFNIATFFGLV